MIAIKRFAFIFLIALTVLLGPFFFGYHYQTLKDASLTYISSAARTRHFHLLLPATGPNLNFCRLLLSAAVTGYPEPVFIGWGGRGMYNGSESHLFKITETLTYLHSLPREADGDLVLVLDAYDIWLQLRPEVMISRYYHVLDQNDARLKAEGILGKNHGGAKVGHGIVFGPDKIHWPQGDRDAAVWAVPESSLPSNAFGPDTDTDMFTARPRWLNSGTIMGPVKDMRDLFEATVDMLSRKFDNAWEFRTSDQFYFAEVWAEQEIGRMRLRDGENFDEAPPVPNGEVGIVPEIREGKRTEFGICLDYKTEIFQTAAAYDHHLTWMRFNQSSETYPELKEPLEDQPETQTAEGLGRELRIDEWVLPGDVARSERPFEALVTVGGQRKRNMTWEEVMLGTNIVTQNPFPLFHVTGDKSLRDRWWPRMWFHPYAEELLQDTKRKRSEQQDRAYFATVEGVRWRGPVPVWSTRHRTEAPMRDEKGGGWSNNGEYVPWREMCGAFEGKELYVRPEDAGKEIPEEEYDEGEEHEL